MEHGILSHDLLTFNFYEKMKLLQRMHMNFEPIVCQYGPNFKIAYVIPCRNLQIHTGSCKHMTIRLLVPQSNENEAVYCQSCAKLANKVSDDVLRRRTAPGSKVPNTNPTDDEKLVKLDRFQKERKKC